MTVSIEDIKALSKKRMIDISADEFANLLIAKMKTVDVGESEFVEIEDRNELLLSKSNTKSNKIMKWGRENGYPVKKAGNSFWRREDLAELSKAYYSSH